jgi:hypothetical protein
MLFRKIICISSENNTNGQIEEFQDVIAGGTYREHNRYPIWPINRHEIPEIQTTSAN